MMKKERQRKDRSGCADAGAEEEGAEREKMGGVKKTLEMEDAEV